MKLDNEKVEVVTLSPQNIAEVDKDEGITSSEKDSAKSVVEKKVNPKKIR